MIYPKKTDVFWIISILCLNCVKNGVLSESKFSPGKSTSEEKEKNNTIRALKKHGITDKMLDKFNKANTDAEKITTEFIVQQLKTIGIKKPLDDKQRSELAKNMLEGVRMWFVALEIELPAMSKYIELVKKHSSTNLELSLHINYFLRTTSSADNKMHNMIVDTMREAGVKKTEVAEAIKPEALGYMGNEKLAQDLIELVLSKELIDA